MGISHNTLRKGIGSTNEGHHAQAVAWLRSGPNTDQGYCVDVRAWQKSSHSADEGECVEVAASQMGVLARDSKDPDGPVLGFGADAWAAFLDTVKSGSLDPA
ncbi:Domain of uncharacterised function (DUF397) [Mycobacterium tuberculosis]|nr:Domain of uncharacterised function (DUF397) [Mycobacterium tuberculosis]